VTLFAHNAIEIVVLTALAGVSIWYYCFFLNAFTALVIFRADAL